MALFASASVAAFCFPFVAAGPVTVIVSRHGIRTPYPPGGDGNLTKESMAKYTTQSFPPCWPPGPGSSDVWGTSVTAGLTPHGGQQIRNMGTWMGSKNFSTVKCEEVAVYADTSSARDNETATNWTLGAFPSCKSLHEESSIIGDPHDFLFNDGTNQELCSFPWDQEVVKSFLGSDKDNFAALLNAWKAQIEKVDQVVHCCSSELCGGQLPCNLSTLPIKFTGKFWAATEGAFDIAVFWAEFFLLEYLNGNPSFAQGKLSVPDLVDLYRMVVANMEFLDNSFSSKRLESTLAAQILGTLLQAHEQKAIEGVGHPKEAKVVYMAGHDTNLLLLRSLLGIRWQSDGWAENAVAPGAMLIVELEERSDGPVVSMYFQVARPEQLHEGTVFSEEQQPSRVQVPITDCLSDPFACPLDTFRKIVVSKLRPKCIGIPGLRDLVESHGGNGGNGSVTWPAKYWWTFLLTGLGACLLGIAIQSVPKRACARSPSSSGYSSQELAG